MNPTGGHTYELSPDDCQTAIDAVSYEKYSRKEQPSYVGATNDFFWKQTTDESLAYIWDEDSNVGAFDETGEQETLENTDTFIGNTKTKKQQKWTKQIPVSLEAFKASQKGKRERIGTQMGDRAELTQTKKTLLNSYGDAFAGTINTTPDGKAPAANDHLTLKGITVDNLETGSYTPDNLWTGIQSLANQKAQDGEAGSHVFEGLLGPFILYKTFKEVMSAELVPYSAENQPNIFETTYGTVRLGVSIFLGSTYNSASNANTSYHMLSTDHTWNRKVFMPFNTDLIDPTKSANDSWAYRGRFMEAHFPETWTGYVGSNGSA